MTLRDWRGHAGICTSQKLTSPLFQSKESRRGCESAGAHSPEIEAVEVATMSIVLFEVQFACKTALRVWSAPTVFSTLAFQSVRSMTDSIASLIGS